MKYKIKFFLSVFLILLLSFPVIFAEERKTNVEEMSYDELVEYGKQLINIMTTTKEDRSDEAVEVFEKAVSMNPSAENRAYLGSSWSLKADRDSNVINKVNYVLKGCDYIDKAVEDEPENVIVRRIRIETYSYFPEEIFQKGSVVDEDLRYLMKLYSTNKDAFNLSTTYDGAWSFYFYGLRLIKTGNLMTAKRYLRTAKGIARDEDLIKEINKVL